MSKSTVRMSGKVFNLIFRIQAKFVDCFSQIKMCNIESKHSDIQNTKLRVNDWQINCMQQLLHDYWIIAGRLLYWSPNHYIFNCFFFCKSQSVTVLLVGSMFLLFQFSVTVKLYRPTTLTKWNKSDYLDLLLFVGCNVTSHRRYICIICDPSHQNRAPCRLNVFQDISSFGGKKENKKKLRSIFDHTMAMLHPVHTWEVSSLSWY